jgi:signal transduction histidine kinase
MSIVKANKLALFISVIIAIGSAIYLININTHDDLMNISVVEGRADVKNLALEDMIYKLSGEWEFYPDVLITPFSAVNVFHEYQAIKKYIYVPGSWQGYLQDHEAAIGKGTYRLIMDIDEETHIGIRVNKARLSSEIWINGVSVGASGNPKEANYKPLTKPHSGFAYIDNNQAEIVIQVNNHNYPSGGLTQEVLFGSKSNIEQYETSKKAINATTILSLWVIGIFLLLLFLHRRNDKYILYFTLFCVVTGAYVILTGEVLILNVFPEMSYNQILSLNLLFAHLAIVFFTLFTLEFFDKVYINRRTIHSVVVVLIMQGIVVSLEILFGLLEIPLLVTQTVSTIVIVLAIVYVSWEFLINASKNNEESGYLIVILTSYFALIISVILNAIFELNPGSIAYIHLLIIITTFSLLFMRRFRNVHDQLEKTTTDLIVEQQLRNSLLNTATNEINSALLVIDNKLKLLTEGEYGSVNKQQNEQMLLLKSAVNRIDNLSKDIKYTIQGTDLILDASRVTDVSIEKIVDLIEEIRVVASKDKRITIETEIADSIHSVYGDEQYIYQIITNLADNAIDSMDSGKLTVSLSNNGNFTKISVRDTGSGLAKADADNIFKPFFRKGKDGIGLGLPITKKLIELHGGSIDFETNFGEGSVFHVYLPSNNGVLQKVSDKQSEINVHRLIGNKATKSILVAESDNFNRNVLSNNLSLMGYTVYQSASIESAMNIIKENKIDIAIIDMVLEDGSGLALCESISNDQQLLELAVILLTRTGQKYIDKHSCALIAVKEYIDKPIKIKDVMNKVQSIDSSQQAILLAVKNEIKFLHIQITPHFLFNTLNTIIALSLRDQHKMRQALEYLATYMQMKLEFLNNDTLVTLSKEMELVTAYLEIEKLRFGDDIIIEKEIDEGIIIRIPSLTIQPLVENAITHGLRKTGNIGRLRITIKEKHNYVLIEIEDNGIGMSTDQLQDILAGKTGRVGFYNVKQKLNLVSGTKFNIWSEQGKGTKITIELHENRYRLQS